MRVATAKAISDCIRFEQIEHLLATHGQDLPEPLFLLFEGRQLQYLNGGAFPLTYQVRLDILESSEN